MKAPPRAPVAPRNLDVAALRSFLTVAETGGVTRASARLNLTQSAVSLQIKRLEDLFQQALFERSGRGVSLTAQGEQLVGYARRLLAANDETWTRMTLASPGGELSVGAPEDLMGNPRIPTAMRDFAARCPDIRINLHSAQTTTLRERFAQGGLDAILTTEAAQEAGGEILARDPLVWIGAPGGAAWRRRPLPIGTVAGCIFNRAAIETLNAAGFDWVPEVDSASNPVMEANIAADVLVRPMMRATVPPRFEVIDHRGALPRLPDFSVNLYVTRGSRRALVEPLAEELRRAYAAAEAIAAE